ncbi:hypothetical protein B296_00008916 [Ensete ventricosum]|uniref:GDSL esterase/lipase n=1 Tax=Ensete ventricosum TaxID=4639 RepID=A0A427BAZ9_ENSVE|nr:hypothetical protein B296_00008916 [Ensete ventricosum]
MALSVTPPRANPLALAAAAAVGWAVDATDRRRLTIKLPTSPPPSSGATMAASLTSVFAAICAFCLLSLASAVDFNYPAVFNFGDSNSDTGDLVAAGIGEPLLPPNGQTYFSRPAGRFCDGRLIIDFLSNIYSLSALPFPCS